MEYDMKMRALADKLSAEYGYWGDHPKWTYQDWLYEVATGNTKGGYWDWVADAILGEGM